MLQVSTEFLIILHLFCWIARLCDANFQAKILIFGGISAFHILSHILLSPFGWVLDPMPMGLDLLASARL
jgi:hypothetical protein